MGRGCRRTYEEMVRAWCVCNRVRRTCDEVHHRVLLPLRHLSSLLLCYLLVFITTIDRACEQSAASITKSAPSIPIKKSICSGKTQQQQQQQQQQQWAREQKKYCKKGGKKKVSVQ